MSTRYDVNIHRLINAGMQQAVNGVAFATFVASGQTCIMGARGLVHEDVYDQFMTALVAKVRAVAG